MGTDDNDTRVTQQVAILADSYSTPRKWSRRERPTDVTRRAVVTSSRSAALTAHDAFPRGPSQPCATTEGAVQQGWQEDQPATTGCQGCGWCWSINAHGQRRYVADDGWRACFDSMNEPG